ncbi:hypothetical protein [Planctomicrobium sp. SH527]|uniref:hypothetical protein n=1 Tax=Planctomicrobium sp. SH527 TaxID=3448123 RepID=UPI003F5B6248
MISAAHNPDDDRSSVPQETPPVRVRSSPLGKWIVAGMLLFGFSIVGALWLYWDSYTRPFRPLQAAIRAQYPETHPYVVGGRVKSHLNNSPNTLRIVLQQSLKDFNPEEDEKASLTRAIELYRIAQQHQDLSQYMDLEIHLVQRVPEQPPRQWSLKLPLKDWADLTTPK